MAQPEQSGWHTLLWEPLFHIYKVTCNQETQAMAKTTKIDSK